MNLVESCYKEGSFDFSNYIKRTEYTSKLRVLIAVYIPLEELEIESMTFEPWDREHGPGGWHVGRVLWNGQSLDPSEKGLRDIVDFIDEDGSKPIALYEWAKLTELTFTDVSYTPPDEEQGTKPDYDWDLIKWNGFEVDLVEGDIPTMVSELFNIAMGVQQ
jgi:hypothetical protein